MLGFVADNASVMMGEFNGVQARFKTDIPDLFVLGCTCHSFNLCANAACMKLPKAVEDLSRDVYNFFSHSAKRKEEFKEFQSFAGVEPHKLLRPCQMRWLSLKIVVDRMLEQWSALILFLQLRQLKIMSLW